MLTNCFVQCPPFLPSPANQRSEQFSVFESYATVRASLDESMKTVTMEFGEIAKMARDNKTKVRTYGALSKNALCHAQISP